MPAIARDLSGIRSGHITFISKLADGSAGKPAMWRVLCDCGREREVYGAWFINGSKTCGHKDCVYHKSIRPQKEWHTELIISDTSITTVHTRYRNGAKSRGYIFELTRKDVTNLITANCHYCGAKPGIKKRNKVTYFANGIDRMDNDTGYTKDNTVTCCSTCNTMKLTLGYNEFIQHIGRIYELHKQKIQQANAIT
jgi:hypothetical protein